jgi:hypothetical protein
MLRPTKTLMACLTVAVALLATVTTTSANNLSQSSRTYRATWTALRIKDIEARGAEALITCKATLEGSFHSSSIRKVRGALVGQITRAATNTCTGGSASYLTETLPWHMKYEAFEGTLPRVTGILHGIIGYGLSVDPTGAIVQCSGKSEAADPITVTVVVAAGLAGFGAGLATAWAISWWVGPPRVSCGTGEIEFEEDQGPVTVLSSTSLISIRLI